MNIRCPDLYRIFKHGINQLYNGNFLTVGSINTVIEALLVFMLFMQLFRERSDLFSAAIIAVKA